MAITQELREYIKDARAHGILDEQIIDELVTAGWSSADINTAISEPTEAFPLPKITTGLPAIENKPVEPAPTLVVSKSITKENFPVSKNTVAVSSTTSFSRPAVTDSEIKVKTPWVKVFLLSLFFGVIFSFIFILIYIFVPPVNSFISSFIENKAVYENKEVVNATVSADQAQNSTNVSTEISIETPTQNNSQPINADIAWKLFDQATLALRDMSVSGDVTKLNAISFRQFPACEAGLEEECMLTGSMLYDINESIEKSEYTNVSSDEKQIILSTNLERSDDNTAKVPTIGYKKGLIFIARDSSGALKIVSVEPDRTWNVNKSTQGSEKLLEDMIVDTDGDGLTDQEEMCIKSAPKCVKTDHTKLDTDGNGYWDGIDYFIKN